MKTNRLSRAALTSASAASALLLLSLTTTSCVVPTDSAGRPVEKAEDKLRSKPSGAYGAIPVRFGQARRIGGDLVRDPSAVSGTSWQGADWETFGPNSWRIPAETGTGIGVGVAFSRMPPGEKLDVELSFPPMTRPDGSVHTQHLSDAAIEYVEEKDVYGVSYVYFFDDDWEVVPGAWRVRFISKGRTLYECTFLVSSSTATIAKPASSGSDFPSIADPNVSPPPLPPEPETFEADLDIPVTE